MTAIAIATLTNKCLPVLMASIHAYVPKDVEVYITGAEYHYTDRKTHCFLDKPASFGEAYNFIVNKAYENHSEVIVANDDIVLDPSSYSKILEDVTMLKNTLLSPLGWVVAKSYRVRPLQNIRNEPEDKIFEVPVVSPLFGYISKRAWIDFPPINWYSDDIQSLDIGAKGFKHYVSRSYIHHVGSATIGNDNRKNHLDAEEWIKTNRPNLHKAWYK